MVQYGTIADPMATITVAKITGRCKILRVMKHIHIPLNNDLQMQQKLVVKSIKQTIPTFFGILRVLCRFCNILNRRGDGNVVMKCILDRNFQYGPVFRQVHVTCHISAAMLCNLTPACRIQWDQRDSFWFWSFFFAILSILNIKKLTNMVLLFKTTSDDICKRKKSQTFFLLPFYKKYSMKRKAADNLGSLYFGLIGTLLPLLGCLMLWRLIDVTTILN